METQTGQNDRQAGEAPTHVNLITNSQFTNTTPPHKKTANFVCVNNFFSL